MNKLTTKINLFYFTSLLAFVCAAILFWQTMFIPFIEKNEQTKADLLLTPYAPLFEHHLDNNNYDDLDILISSLMLLKDVNSKQPLILSLNLKLIGKNNIQQVNEQRKSHFVNNIAIFSPTTFELLGNLEIQYNDYTYQKIVDNSNDAIIILVAVCVLLFIFGKQILTGMISPLSKLSAFLKDVDADNIVTLPEPKGKLSTEIDSVWNATQIMLNRIRERENELIEKHEIAQQALKEKLEAEAASQSKSRFLANMSHEIRTPLTAIIGFADSLQDEKMQSEKRLKATQTIMRNGNHLLGIINDILDLSKIESDKLEVEQLAVSPLQIIQEVESLFESQITRKKLDFVVNYTFPLPKLIISDSTRVRQILFNLLSNAIKFTETGSIKLEIVYLESQEQLKISVTDSGIGLSEQQSQLIFSPFSQADISTTRKYGGTGLGLTISRKLANMLGGDLLVTSKPGKGATFVLSIATGKVDECFSKLTQYKIGEVSRTPEFDVSLLSGNVLVVEDTRDIQELISYYLEQTSANLTFADNGEVAVDFVTKQDFDLILMDIQMPVLDGIGATRQIRSKGIEKPIIALSANAMQEDRDLYKESGFTDFVAKPIDRLLLFEVLRKYLPMTSVSPRRKEQIVDEKEEKKRKTKERLKKRFKENLPQWLSDISAAIQNKDDQALCKTAHVLKGLGGSFGFPEITDMSANVESMGKESNFEQAQIYFNELQAFCNNVIENDL